MLVGGHYGIKQGEPNAMLDVRDVLTDKFEQEFHSIHEVGVPIILLSILKYFGRR
jgi:hypothetical protein